MAKWQLPTVANTNKPTRNQTKQNRKSYFFSCSFGEFQYFFYLFYADDTLCSFNVHIGVQSCNAVQCWELSRGDTVTVWRIYEREPWRGDSRFSDTADITYWWEDSASKSREKGDGPSRTPRTSIQSMFSLSINTALYLKCVIVHLIELQLQFPGSTSFVVTRSFVHFIF